MHAQTPEVTGGAKKGKKKTVKRKKTGPKKEDNNQKRREGESPIAFPSRSRGGYVKEWGV